MDTTHAKYLFRNDTLTWRKQMKHTATTIPCGVVGTPIAGVPAMGTSTIIPDNVPCRSPRSLTSIAMENFNLIQIHYAKLGAADANIHDELGFIIQRAVRNRPFPHKPEWLLQKTKTNLHLLASEELTNAALHIYRAVQSTGELS